MRSFVLLAVVFDRVLVQRWVRGLAMTLFFLVGNTPARGQELSEYQIKAGFLYNFAALTSWPVEVGGALNLCVYGRDPFGVELDALKGKMVGQRALVVQRKSVGESLKACQIVFFPVSEAVHISNQIMALQGQPTLTVAESPDAVRLGVMLGLRLSEGRVSFEANQGAARRAGLTLSSKLLRLATEVYP
ncbi:MAG: hypothetical protein RL300_1287 [Pseudomonadota bacterium]|jgi:hypothetical protein